MSQEPPFDRPDVAVPDGYDDLDLIFDLGLDGGGDGGGGDADDDAGSGRLDGLAGSASIDEIRRFIERTAETLPGNVDPSTIELEKIPRRLWEQTLAPLHPQQRMWAARRVPNRQLSDLAFRLVFALDAAESRRRDERAVARGRARRSGAPLPTPTGDHATRRGSIQVNMRVRGDDHERLRQAAEAVGCRPTTLARSLVLNGVAMILRDHALQR